MRMPPTHRVAPAPAGPGGPSISPVRPVPTRRAVLGRIAELSLGLSVGLGGAAATSPARAQYDDELLRYAPRASAPPGYPTGYASLIRAAEDEGRLVIHATTDERVAAPLVADFRRLYPRITVAYEDLNSTELYHRVFAEDDWARESADVLWSSAMDQLMSLAVDGHAQTYASPEVTHLPAWARWQDQIWATTYEPVVFAHHKPSLPDSAVPRSHRALGPWLAQAAAAGEASSQRVVSYDLQKSGVGYFLATQDAAADSASFWDAAAGLGRVERRLLLTTDSMVRLIAAGRAHFGMNLLGAYTVNQARRLPTIGVIFPEDYTLITSRVLVISRRARHPNAARLWLDYLLSARGQTLMATTAGLYALREGVAGETTGSALRRMLGERARPVVLEPALATPLADAAYGEFIRRWRAALGRGG